MLKKTSTSPLFIIFFSISVLAVFFIVHACRKMDRQQGGQNPADRLLRFFAEHPPTNQGVRSITDFMKRQNAQSEFVNTIIDRVGYPRWDKSFAVTPSTNAAAKTGTNENLDFYFIPFVRDSQQFVNACLVIKAEGKDTSYKWLNDWQYKNISHTGISKRATSALLMQIDYEVFGNHRKYLVKDTSVLDSRGSEVSIVGTSVVNASVQARAAVVQVCVTYLAPVNGWLTGCAPGSPCNPYHEVTQCFDLSLEDDPGSSDNFNNGTWSGIPSGGGGGGGWTPPADPCAPVTYNGRVQYPPGCSGPTPTPWTAIIDAPLPYGIGLYDSWWVDATDEAIIDYWENNNIETSRLDSCRKVLLRQLTRTTSGNVLGKILAKIERSTGANNNLEKFKVTYRILPSGNYAAVTDSFRYDPSTGIFACRITLDSADVRNSTDVHLAQAILHENIHAYMMSLLMRRWGGTSLAALEMMTYDSIFTQHIDTLAVSDSAQLHALALSQDYDHNYMQSKLLSLIADAIRLFDRNAINNDRYYWYLAWGGLYGTKPWLTHWPNYNTPPPGNWPIVGAPYTTEDSTRGMRYALTPTRLDSIVRVQNAERFSSPTSKGRKPKPGGCYN